MINCLALQGQSGSAIATFGKMEAEGPEPDEVTFVGILNACVHGGLVDEGLRCLGSMVREYRIKPKIEHYGWRLGDAMGVVRQMGFEPDEVVWGSLLNACRIHKDVGLAEFATRKLMEMKLENGDYGVMLANMYSESGEWEEVGKVRKQLKEGGGKKLPDCSWIEVDSEVRQFYSGDKVQAGEVLKVLQDLVLLMEMQNC